MVSNQLDSIVTKIVERFTTRAQVGQNKYGTNLDRTDLSTTEWLTHLIEELHDAILYAEKARQESINRDRLLDLFMKQQLTSLDSGEFEEFSKLYREYVEKQKNS